MATKNLVPRFQGEGDLGSLAKFWANVRAVWGTFTNLKVGTLNGILQATDGIISVSEGVGVESGYGPNLLLNLNPSFETLRDEPPSFMFANWYSVVSTPFMVAETTLKHSGSRSAKLTASKNNGPVGNEAGWDYIPQLKVDIQPEFFTVGKQYRVSGWVYGNGDLEPTPENQGRVTVEYLLESQSTEHPDGVVVQRPLEVVVGSTLKEWTKFTMLTTVPIGTLLIRIYLMAPLEEDGYCYYDDISFQEITSSVITPPRIILPKSFDAVVDEPLQLFTRGIIEAPDPYAYAYEATCAKGENYPRYFEFTPVPGDITTTTPLKFEYDVLGVDGKPIYTSECDINVKAAVAQPDPAVRVLCLGDSFTAAGHYPKEFYRLLAESGGTPAGKGYSNITFVGDKQMDTYTTQSYTGFAGWKWWQYAGTDKTDTTQLTCGHRLTAITSGDDKTMADVGSLWYVSANGANSAKYSLVRTTPESGQIKFAVYADAVDVFPAAGTLVYSSGATNTTSIVYTARSNEPPSPFWNPDKGGGAGIDFTHWVADHTYTTIDVLYVLLGWNGMTEANLADAADWDLADMEIVLNQFHADYPDAMVKLMGINVPSPTGGTGAAYGSNSVYANYYKLLRNVNGLNLAYQAYATTNSTWVEFISISQQVDSEYNMNMEQVAVNSRNSSYTEMRGSDGLHPTVEGYWQIADAAYRNFIKNYCQGV